MTDNWHTRMYANDYIATLLPGPVFAGHRLLLWKVTDLTNGDSHEGTALSTQVAWECATTKVRELIAEKGAA